MYLLDFVKLIKSWLDEMSTTMFLKWPEIKYYNYGLSSGVKLTGTFSVSISREVKDCVAYDVLTLYGRHERDSCGSSEAWIASVTQRAGGPKEREKFFVLGGRLLDHAEEVYKGLGSYACGWGAYQLWCEEAERQGKKKFVFKSRKKDFEDKLVAVHAWCFSDAARVYKSSYYYDGETLRAADVKMIPAGKGLPEGIFACFVG